MDIPEHLGGYEVVKQLGKGGMGSVYLARQISLDRSVALKVMNQEWSRHPIFVARFTREAYAAAQLVHHNVVQIYDIGAHQEIHFFSMEFVEGRSLGELIRKQGKLVPEEALGYILQAARGLKHAHDFGMIHRDVKPDNLMINNFGIVKVADLGLVKTPHTSEGNDKSSSSTSEELHPMKIEVTHANAAMGSPAYMSPEQCRDAGSVDQRADIYSLGCTLYVLLTGRTPFSGTTAVEVMSKHLTEPVIPPETIVSRVPKEISGILLKMMAKDPNDRYPNMDALIQDIENWFGVRSNRPFSPNEEHLTTLEKSAATFNAAPVAKLRNQLLPGFLLGGLGLSLILAFLNSTLMIGMISLMFHAILAYFILNGMTQKGYLFRKTREVLFGIRLADWGMIGFSTLLFAGVLFLTEYIWIWLGMGLLGIGIAIALHFLIDRKLAAQRISPLEECEHMFKRLRLQGLDEENIRLFVAKFSGNRWEEFFETLFGYEEKIKLRSLVSMGEGGRKREKFAAWRDPLIRRLEGLLQFRKEAQERKVLQTIEAKKLEAEGLSKQEAQEQAEAAAEQLVAQAAELKAAEKTLTRPERLEATVGAEEAVSISSKPTRVTFKKMLEVAEKPPQRKLKPPINPISFLMEFVFGWKLRFILAVLLLAGGALWFRDFCLGGLSQSLGSEQALMNFFKALVNQPVPLPLSLVEKWLPSVVGDFFNYINPLVAGLLLFASLFFRGDLMSLMFLISATVIMLAHKLGLPDVGPIKAYVGAMILGAAIAVIGILLARRRGE